MDRLPFAASARAGRANARRSAAPTASVPTRRWDATREEDIRRHAIKDGQDPDASVEDFALVPKTLRLQRGMTHESTRRRRAFPWRRRAIGSKAAPGQTRLRRRCSSRRTRRPRSRRWRPRRADPGATLLTPATRPSGDGATGIEPPTLPYERSVLPSASSSSPRTAPGRERRRKTTETGNGARNCSQSPSSPSR